MRIGKILLGLFAAIGLYVVVSLLTSMLLPKPENTCSVFWSKEYPSPNGHNKLVDELLSCGNGFYKRQIALRGENYRDKIPIIFLSKADVVTINGVAYSPPPVGVYWETDYKIVLRVADDSAPSLDRYGDIAVESQKLF